MPSHCIQECLHVAHESSHWPSLISQSHLHISHCSLCSQFPDFVTAVVPTLIYRSLSCLGAFSCFSVCIECSVFPSPTPCFINTSLSFISQYNRQLRREVGYVAYDLSALLSYCLGLHPSSLFSGCIILSKLFDLSLSPNFFICKVREDNSYS